jgi:hypothetical protein
MLFHSGTSQKTFLLWLNAVDPDDDYLHQQAKEDHNIYLVAEMSNNDEVRAWLAHNFELIFQNELNDWYTDEGSWPQKRTYTMFSQWFEVEVHSMLLDIEQGPITKE